MLIIQFWWLCELLYTLCNCALKMALGIFYLRVAVRPWHIWSIKLLMAGTVLFGLTYFFLVLFQCIPGEHAGSNKLVHADSCSVGILDQPPSVEQVHTSAPNDRSNLCARVC
jgi:hypothetical protein